MQNRLPSPGLMVFLAASRKKTVLCEPPHKIVGLLLIRILVVDNDDSAARELLNRVFFFLKSEISVIVALRAQEGAEHTALEGF